MTSSQQHIGGIHKYTATSKGYFQKNGENSKHLLFTKNKQKNTLLRN